MKTIMIVDLDDTFMPLNEDTITLEKGTIKYRDMNGNPFKITVEGLKLKPMPEKKNTNGLGNDRIYYYLGYNYCIDEILGEEE